MTNTGFAADLAFYEQIFNLSKAPIFVKDLQSRFLHVNNAFCVLYGLAYAEVIGNTEMDFIQSGKCKIVQTRERALLDPAIPQEFTNYEILVMEPPAYFRVIQYPFITTQNETFIFGTYENLAKTMAIRQKLRESEVFSKTLVNNSPNLIMIHINDKVVFANCASTNMTGYQPKGIIGKNIIDLLKLREFNRHGMLIQQPLLSSINPGDYMEVQAETKNGGKRYFLLISSRILHNSERAIMSILVDLTERVELENAMVGKVIETGENERKMFAADLHDDLGPLLSSIKLYLGLIDPSSAKGTESQDFCGELLDEAIDKISSIANNLMPRLIENFGLESALLSLCKRKSKFNVFSAELNSNLGNFRLRNEVELHLYRITSELLNNSIKHSGGNKAFIRLTYNNGMLQLVYADNGLGYNIKELVKDPKGSGIANILHRVALIHGEIGFTKRNDMVEVSISVKDHKE